MKFEERFLWRFLCWITETWIIQHNLWKTRILQPNVFLLKVVYMASICVQRRIVTPNTLVLIRYGRLTFFWELPEIYGVVAPSGDQWPWGLANVLYRIRIPDSLSPYSLLVGEDHPYHPWDGFGRSMNSAQVSKCEMSNTPQKINKEPKHDGLWWFGRWFSFSRGVFS